MGIFGKKRNNDESLKLNEILSLSLDIEEKKSSLNDLPDSVNVETKQLVHNIKFYAFEYVKQLKEAFVFSKGSVKKFILNDYSWVNKQNVERLIQIGLDRIN